MIDPAATTEELVKELQRRCERAVIVVTVPDDINLRRTTVMLKGTDAFFLNTVEALMRKVSENFTNLDDLVNEQPDFYNSTTHLSFGG